MTNRVVRTTRRGWGSRLISSIGGIFFGILLFFGSFILLWMNEGRTDMSRIAARSMAVSAAAVDPAGEGQLVAASGRLVTDETLGDPGYLAAGPYVKLERQVEMYAWVERSRSRTERTVGGGETTVTEYTYETTWTANPPDSSRFEEPAGRANPQMTIQRQSYTVNQAQVGAYSLDPARLDMPAMRAIPLNEEIVIAGEGHRLSGDYIFSGAGSLQQPQVGDIRISYRAVPANIDVTVFGKQEGNRITPYVDGRDTLYSAYAGDRDSAIAAMAAAHRTTGWLLRGGGFLMMWIGLGLILGPISVFLDVLPFLGNLSRTMIGFITFGVALVLSAITIVVAAIMQSIFGLICLGLLFLLLIGGGIGALFALNRRRSQASPA